MAENERETEALERRAAHERLSTGALSHWTHAVTRHIVRMTLVPSLFTLLREHTWYMPRWLDTALPNITIEPPHDVKRRRPVGEAPQPEPSEA
jgi:hypothetical protein